VRAHGHPSGSILSREDTSTHRGSSAFEHMLVQEDVAGEDKGKGHNLLHRIVNEQLRTMLSII
jgi:hypothetical protein